MKFLVFLSTLVALVVFITISVVYLWIVESPIHWIGALITVTMGVTILIVLTPILVETIQRVRRMKRAQ